MSDKLKEYRRKRDFGKTEEPSGERRTAGRGPTRKFAVQYHLARREHYDFRLEWQGVLLSWAIPKGPSYNPQDKRLAVRVEDHPLDYADFEGTIPQGEYGGGTVMLWDEGTWEAQTDFARGLESGSLKITLYGRRLRGNWALVRLKEEDGENKNWLLIKERDAFAKRSAGISRFKTGIRSGLDADAIAAAGARPQRNPFDRLDFQLAKLADEVPVQEGWLYEIKYDGYRIAAFCEAGAARLVSRNGHDFTDRFPRIAAALADWSRERAMVLDGEMIVADDKGRSDFGALQRAMKNPEAVGLVYMIFDLPALDGKDLRGLPLAERKARLEDLLATAPDCLRYSRHVLDKGRRFFALAADLRLEGIIGKKADSTYRGDRGGDWIKVKCYRRQEFVIGGYTLSAKKTSGVSAVLLGVYEGKELVYAGRAGSGIGEREAGELAAAFARIETDTPPFVNPPRVRAGERLCWLAPRMVAEIQFAEWTGDDVLRQASFQGLREDKAPRDVVREDRSPARQTRGRAAAAAAALPEKRLSVPGARPGSTARRGAGGEEATNAARVKAAGRQERKPRTVAAAGRPAAGNGTAGGAGKTARPGAKRGRNGAEKETKTQNRRGADQSPRSARGSGRTAGQSARDGESPIVRGVAISSPDKIVFRKPETTKLDVIRYYDAVAARMMAYCAHRVLSVVRCHRGISAACFFKKHPAGQGPGMVIVPIENADGESSDYFYLENAAGLIAEAQLGSLEFHVWGSRAETLERPDFMVFDLDPDEGMPLERIRQGVRDLRSLLAKLSLKAFLKTSGGKGYHVVVPFRPAAGWETFHDFARGIAKLMEQKWPDRYTANVRKIKRQGKIYIDWARNGRGSTSVAPYSLRARPGAKVSMPISWRELDTVAPDGVDLADALERVKGRDPWRDFFATAERQELTGLPAF